MRQERIGVAQVMPFIVLAIFVFFRNFFAASNLWDLLIMAAVFLLMAICLFINLPSMHIRLTPFAVGGVVSIATMILSWCCSISLSSSVKFTAVIGMFWILAILYSFLGSWHSLFIGVLKYFALFHIGIAFISVCLPSLSLKVFQRILPLDQFQITQRWMFENGAYAGISGQIGTIAFFEVVAITIFLSTILVERKRISNIALLLLAAAMLILSQKRGLTLAIAIAAACVVFVYWLSKRKDIKWIVVAAILMSIALPIMLMIFPPTRTMIMRTLSPGALTGRGEIYAVALEVFADNPWLGNGIGTLGGVLQARNVLSGIVSTGHNIYLQLLAEVGIGGFVAFVATMLFTLADTVLKLMAISKCPSSKRSGESALLMSLTFQIFFMVYGMSGNPLFDYTQFAVYVFFVAGGYSSYFSQIGEEKIEQQ